jgi:AcrR family transcriptional regulator
MPILHADRSPAAAARLVRALEVLDQRRDGDVPRQGATVAELCRLAGVSRNSVYRYHPDIVTALRLQQRGSAPDNGARHSHAGPAPSDNIGLQDQVSKLAALVDHYYAAYREARVLLDRRDRELSELRRKLDAKPVPVSR